VNYRKTIDIHYQVSFDYINMNKVMRNRKNWKSISGMEMVEETGLPIGKSEDTKKKMPK
jgi:hypothetical protein